MKPISILILIWSGSAFGQIGIPFPGPGHTIPAAGGACQTGYAHCKQLTVGTVTGTLTDFPVLVDVTLGASKITNASCYDVAFSTTQAGTTPLYWELEPALCNSTTGRVAAWVKDTIATGTTFWIQYGGSQSTFQSTVTSVWNANYKGVWHLTNNGTAVLPTDSTTLAGGSLVAGSTVVAGKIDSAEQDNGSNCIEGTNSVAFVSTSITPHSASAWLYPTTFSSTLFWWGFGERDNSNYSVAGYTLTTSGNLGWSDDSAFVDSGLPLTLNAWNYVAISRTATQIMFRVNGNSATISNADNQDVGATGGIDRHTVGCAGTNGAIAYYYVGYIDEVKASNVARGDAWHAAEYANTNAPGTFITAGTEQ